VLIASGLPLTISGGVDRAREAVRLHAGGSGLRPTF
jgi:hypothetical protein